MGTHKHKDKTISFAKNHQSALVKHKHSIIKKTQLVAGECITKKKNQYSTKKHNFIIIIEDNIDSN